MIIISCGFFYTISQSVLVKILEIDYIFKVEPYF